ncbi:MAG TPA: hypothetical protein VN648_19600 [Candidatus Methylomirabilis sp.]|nr:hypothetical protein [Candidatus Methylomirabilis sp.]
MSTSTPQGPPAQTLPIGNVAPETQQAITSLPQYNIGAQFSPNVQQIAQQYLSNPYTAGAQGGANLFGGMGTANALQGLGAAGQMYNYMPGLSSAAQNLFTQANDPQQATFDWLQNMQQQQTGASLAGTGLGNTPYGASVMGNTMGNLDIQWQQQLLQRAMQGDQAAANMLQAATVTGNQAFNLGQGAVGAGVNAGFLPSTAYQQILGGQLMGPQQATAYGQQIAQIPQMQIGDFLNQMGQYNQANSVANQAYSNQLQANQDLWSRYVQMAQGVGTGLGTAAGGLGMVPGGGFGSPGTFSAPGTYFGGAGGGTGWNAMNPYGANSYSTPFGTQ